MAAPVAIRPDYTLVMGVYGARKSSVAAMLAAAVTAGRLMSFLHLTGPVALLGQRPAAHRSDAIVAKPLRWRGAASQSAPDDAHRIPALARAETP